MSQQQLGVVLKNLPSKNVGFIWRGLHEFIDGNVSITKRKTVKMTIELPLDELGAQAEDVRAVLPPHVAENKLVPLLVFIDVEKAAAFYQEEKKNET